MNIRIEPLYEGKISELIAKHCDADRLEMLDYCQSLGEVYVGYIDGEFICCWGLIPPSFLSDQAYLWLWTPRELKYQSTFIRQSQIQIQRMLKVYNRIVGECHVGARSSRRWLQWLGAEFGQPENGLIPFTIEKQHG